MKNYILGLISIAALVASLQSCNEDIELSGQFEETAVVFGLIDQSDSVHMIKITRAFIGPGNSLEFAQIPDSNYFESVVATVTEKINGSNARVWTLFDTIVLNKDENGIFYAPEQKVYAFYTGNQDNSDSPTGASINPNATYKLDIDINNGLFSVSGETEIVTGISSPQGTSFTHFHFAEGSSTTGEFNPNGSVTIDPGNAKRINASLELNYREFIGANETDATVTWKLGELETPLGSNEVFTTNGEVFYNLLAADCSTADPLIDKRNFISITVKAVGGSEDLNNYILVNKPASSLAQNKPTFTNLTATKGHEVVGLFSSRYTYQSTVLFSDPASIFVRCIDSPSTMELCMGSITGPYLFCSQHLYDISQGESYICP